MGLRGSSGSGKSYVGHALVAEYKLPGPEGDVVWPVGAPPISNKEKEKLIGHRLRGGLFVLGGYKPRFACGGMDTLGTGVVYKQFPMLKRAALKFDHVFFESLMMSFTSTDRLVELCHQLNAAGAPSMPLKLATMDTPVELCRTRVRGRRDDAPWQRSSPINEENTIVYAHKRVHVATHRLVAAGFDNTVIDHTKAYEQVVELLKEGGWKP